MLVAQIQRLQPPLRMLSRNSLPQRRQFARREAPLAPLSNPVEQAIQAAQQRGDLNNLTGAGKPLKQDSASSLSHVMHASSGSSTSNLLSTKAEFEMRRATLNKELELEHMHGKALEYKGTNITGSSVMSGGSGGADSLDSAMGAYILIESQPSVTDLKSL